MTSELKRSLKDQAPAGVAGGRRGHRGLLVGVALFATVACFYLLTAPDNRTESDDGFVNAHDVETAPLPGLLRPFHPLYLPLMRGLFSLAKELGLAQRAYPLMNVVSALVGALTVLLFGVFLRRRLGVSTHLSAAGAGLLGCSYAFWRYATEADVYALAALLAVAVLLASFKTEATHRDAAFAAPLAALAVLGHIFNAMLVFVVVPLFLLLCGKARQGATYLAISVALVLPAMWAAYALAPTDNLGYVEYYLGNRTSGLSDPTGRPGVQATDLVRGAVSLGHTVASGNFLFAYAPVREKVVEAFPAQMLEEERYLGAHAGILVRLIAPVTALAFLVLVFAAVLHPRGAPKGLRREPAVIAALTWLLLFAVALVVLESGPEGWLLTLLPLWTLFVLSVRWLPPAIASAALVLLLAHNAVGGMAPLYGEQGDYSYQKTKWLVDHTGPGDIVLTADRRFTLSYLRYYAAAKVVDLQLRDSTELRDSYRAVLSAPGDVYATAEVFRPLHYYEVTNPEESADLRHFARSIQDRFTRVVDNGFGGVYRRWE